MHANSPSSHAPSPNPVPAVTASTVHRTDSRNTRGKRTQAELQVSTNHHTSVLNSNSVRDKILFPEINISSPQSHQACTPIISTEDRGKGPIQQFVIPQVITRRTYGKKKSRIKCGDKGMIDIEVQHFIDVPIQHAEGLELLALIGSSVPIPSHIIHSSKQQNHGFEVGQFSKAQSKKSRQPGNGPIQRDSQDTQPIGSRLSPIRTRARANNRQAIEEPIEEIDEYEPGLSIQLNQLDSSTRQQLHSLMGSHQQPTMDEVIDTEDQDDDPYMDTVDYSEDDMDT